MAYVAEADKSAIIEQLRQHVLSRWPESEAAVVADFVAAYYRGIAPADLAQRSTEDLYGAAVSHWQLLRQPHASWPRIHVYNPNAEQHGWESSHTVIQIAARDMPFLVDSVSMALNRLELTVHLIVHPVLRIVERATGPAVVELDADEGEMFACMHFEVDRQTEPGALERIAEELHEVLADVERAVTDWPAMREAMQQAIDDLKRNPPPLPSDELEETIAFLEWIADDHFTFLGYRRYDFRMHDNEPELEAVPGSGLGILHSNRSPSAGSFAHLPRDIRLQAKEPRLLVLTKSSRRATVHRPSYMDYLGIQRFDSSGNVIGEHRFLGLYTSSAYNRNPREIPLLRRKVDYVLGKAGLPRQSHAGKALLNILETYPRDELIQIDTEQLYETAIGILHLQERQRVRAFVRYDTFQRFVSCLVFVPRERYNTDVRQQMQTVLEKTFGGEQTEFDIRLSESVLARIHFIVRLPQRGRPSYDAAELEAELAQTLRSWPDDYHQALLEYLGEERGARLFRRYRSAFSAAYREDTPPRTAVHDTERLESLHDDSGIAINLYRPLEAAADTLRFKLYHRGDAIILSDVLPVLENMGVQVIDERRYLVELPDANGWIHDFGLRHTSSAELDTERIRDTFQEAFAAIWSGRVENDGFNRLTLSAGLSWRDIVILRAYCKYLRQAGTTLSQGYIEETLDIYPQITRLLVELFHARFDPAQHDAERAEELTAAVEAALEEVPSLDRDRILRRYLAAIRATVRTNHFRTAPDGQWREFLSLKLMPAQIPEMPKPYPFFEIFVYSPRFEGVHLRGGRVARGGLRWSDRQEDFRAEVLGLLKAQTVKNSVIVPVGAKGGFVLKQEPEERDALQADVRACYANFIRGLLDVTDNRTEQGIVPPPQVVRHDEDDPYLVVAADKGTATFSDLANQIAAEYDFWLRDAFASGGSSGYDHKGMGITARGAWESVKRHFRELGLDIQRNDFSVVGIGDMSGDVFGNGMLLSRHIRLVAAFDHRHIFIDPNPDPEVSFAERQRLFKLPRSSWADYDPEKLSQGGGVYPRTAKSIRLSKEAQQVLGIDQEELSPNALIQAILSAPVDLLWNGGIGTYIKASDESHAEVGDKSNDAVRVDASQVRCRVVGEGGNLGVTQRGRIELARRGCRINTDAIDNAGGVVCSDHEVNIKILLNDVVANGDMTSKQRDNLLSEMTDEVARLVLANNYRQSQALTLDQLRGSDLLDEQTRFIHMLEKEGRLERALEFLPDDEALAERLLEGRGLTRPELAVLLSYAKLHSYGELLEDESVDDPFLMRELMAYFPRQLQERFPDQIGNHRLRREITATVVINQIVDRMGSTFFFRLADKLGARVGDATRAYLAAREIFGLGELWAQVEALDNRIAAAVQMQLLLDLSDLHERATHWLLRNQPAPQPIDTTVMTVQPALTRLRQILPQTLPASERTVLEHECERLASAGVPEPLAQTIAQLDMLYPTLDIVKVAGETAASLELVGGVYFTLMTELGLNWLRARIDEFAPANSWQERVRAGLEEELYAQLRALATDVLGSSASGEPLERVQRWIDRNQLAHRRLSKTMSDLRSASQLDISMLTVAIQELAVMVQSGTQRPLTARRRTDRETPLQA